MCMESKEYINQNNHLPYSNCYTPIQLKLPLVFDEIIEKGDPIYTFENLMTEVDLRKYLVDYISLVALNVIRSQC